MMRRIDRRGEAEGGISSGIENVGPRDVERAAELVEIFVVRQSGRLVEPLRHQELGGNAFAFAPVRQPHAHPHERLRRLGERDHAETEGQPELDRALIKRRLREA
jgi:hypothetical protein